MTRPVDSLLDEARSRIGPRLSPAEASAAQAAGALLVDIRPVEQRRRDGEVPGALVIDRNVLEWRLDPASPWRSEAVTSHDQPVVVLCNEGYQSSLAAAGLASLGFSSVTDVDGGFQAWRSAGMPVEGGGREVAALLDEVQAIGRAGLHFSEDPYDRERYQRLVDLAARGYADLGGLEAGEVRRRWAAEVGCITPKVGADAAVFDDEGRILLVQRSDDRCWGLVSGWVEPGEHPADTVVREAQEEVGLDLEVGPLVGVFARPATAEWGPHAVVSIVYRCRVVGGGDAQPSTDSHEVLDARYWPIADVPHWHKDHQTFAEAAAVTPPP
jgi:ADP-ribose pyrophosphatase YjhB (NUDIX family)/rhodanese-related sulfurtransferase